MSDWWDDEPEHEERRPARARDMTAPRPGTPLTRSLRPSFMLAPIVLIVLMLLFRLRLPPLPFGLLVVGGVWLVCFILIFLWQSRAGAGDDV